MIQIRGKRIGWSLWLLVAALIYVWLTMLIPGWGEWYSRSIYPVISYSLSRFSSIFPFSLGDCFIYGSIAGLLVYIVLRFIRKQSWRHTLWFVVRYLAWVYVWFYIGWGLNYYRDDFFRRTGNSPAEYSKERYVDFLQTYTDSLNATYVPFDSIDKAAMAETIKKDYKSLDSKYGLLKPYSWDRPKPMLVEPIMSGTGIMGYMGPFFSEFNLNPDLLPVQYPFTYAHEMAHLLGITNEAEANLYAHLVGKVSSDQQIRFASYFGLLTYVIENAARLLTPEEYEAWTATLRPEVKDLYNHKMTYWQSRYSPFIGKIQHSLYNLYLKGNNISSGHDNYSEVITLLLSQQK